MKNRHFDNCLKIFRSVLKMTETCVKMKRLREEEITEITRSIQDDQVEKKLKISNEDDNKNDGKQRIKYGKYAMLVSFCGQGYFGMQINGDTPTIESELLTALRKCDLIDGEDRLKPGDKLNFQRAARTDKNVSAVKQMCSLKLNRNLHDELNTKFVTELNGHLPEKIKIWVLVMSRELRSMYNSFKGFIRTTQGFNAKNSCDNRTYSYTMPSFALSSTKNFSEDQFVKIQSLLDRFKGTSNYFNFTSGRLQDDKSCNRYIIACKCEKPFEIDGTEFITITIRGQSFMLHQIRKIVGLTIAVTRGFVDDSIIPRALSNQTKVDVPKAPGLGLVLEEVHYDWYNRRYEKTHDKICWDKFEDNVRYFRRNFIDKTILETEMNTKSMIEWLKVLDLHEFSSSVKKQEATIDVYGETPSTDSLNVHVD